MIATYQIQINALVKSPANISIDLEQIVPEYRISRINHTTYIADNLSFSQIEDIVYSLEDANVTFFVTIITDANYKLETGQKNEIILWKRNFDEWLRSEDFFRFIEQGISDAWPFPFVKKFATNTKELWNQ